ncbi:MAG TPA: hypothetical protein VFP92_13065 [Rhodanobacteraceae bacterium]|nr:hypothetical protein [Rhodanobacteraceae bacterium]
MMRDGGNLILHRLRANTGAQRRKAPCRRDSVASTLAALAGRALLAASLATWVLVPVHARAGELNGAVSVTSQLVDRGLAITSPTPALQGGIAWTTTSGWSLGLSGGVELRSPGHLSAGVARVARAWTLSPNWRIQANLVYYHYAGRLDADVYEPGVYLLYRDVLTFGVSGVHVVGADGHALHPAADLNFHWPMAGGFSISGGLGVARYAVPYGVPPHEHYHTGYYRYGQAGLLWSHGAWQIEVDRVVVDPGARRYLRGRVASPWLATVSWSF